MELSVVMNEQIGVERYSSKVSADEMAVASFVGDIINRQDTLTLSKAYYSAEEFFESPIL